MKKLFTFLLALCTSISLWADNTITYTASEKLSETTDYYDYVSGLHTNAFNVSITSHTFADGTGTITFAGDVTSIGNYAFYNCSGLTSITIPNSVTSIGSEAFYGCSGLTSITIPSSVTSIGIWAFYNCSGLTSAGPIGGDYSYKFGWTESIPNYAFADCSGLTSVTIPESVTSIGKCACDGCYGLTSVTWNAANCASPSSQTYAPFYGIRLQITSFMFGDNVKTIPAYLCYGMISLTSVTIPNSVTSIGKWAFDECTGLTSITIPESVTSIGDPAFSDCSGLTSLVVESGNATFDSRNNCNAIIETATNTLITGCQSTIIPESVTSIGASAFNGCSGLTSITIPNSVTSIGEYAFAFCYGLTSITIPDSVTSIGEYAFYGCSGLTSVTIGEGVTSIGDRAFYYCSGLTSITIPNSVNIIGNQAFEDCIGLTSITAEGVRPAVCASNSFSGVDRSIPLYVPAGSVSAYQAANGWRDFTTILPIPSPIGNIVVVSSDETMGAAYGTGAYNSGEEALIFAIPADGYKFTAWNDGETSNPRTVLVAGDSTFTASFAPVLAEASYEVNVSSVNPAWGSASAQEAVVLTAVPEAGYKFLMWSDGNTENPRAIILTDDINLTAIFNVADALVEIDAPESDLRKELIQGKVYITRDGSTCTILGTKIK